MQTRRVVAIEWETAEDPRCLTAQIKDEFALVAIADGSWEIWDTRSLNRMAYGKERTQADAQSVMTNIMENHYALPVKEEAQKCSQSTW